MSIYVFTKRVSDRGDLKHDLPQYYRLGLWSLTNQQEWKMEEKNLNCTWGTIWCFCLLVLQIRAHFLKNRIYPLYFSIGIIAANKYLHKPPFRQSFPLKLMAKSCAVMNFHVLTAAGSSSATGSAVSMNVPLPSLQRYELLFEMLGICCLKCFKYKKHLPDSSSSI